jgi:hypothetical protein
LNDTTFYSANAVELKRTAEKIKAVHPDLDITDILIQPKETVLSSSEYMMAISPNKCNKIFGRLSITDPTTYAVIKTGML